MKNILKFLAVAVFAVIANTSFAADKITTATVVAGTPTNILSGGKYVVTDILFVNAGATNGVVKLYDSTGVTTNYVIAAYTNYTTVSTNWSTTFTNATGIIITNTFTGISHVPTAVAAATNELPARLSFLIPASNTRTFNGIAVQPAKGITLYSTVGGLVEIGYRQFEP